MQKRLPETMTIRQVKLIAQRKFKSLRADDMELYYRDKSTAGHPEHLNDDDKDLAYYGIQDGGEILMEERRGDKSSNNSLSEAENAAREKVETMEAIRLAQREEVEAARSGTAAAAAAKVSAADAVPFVSKIR
jgi:hypothetical protein